MLKAIMATNAGWGTTIIRVITGIIFMGHGLPKIGVGSERTLQGVVDFLGGGLGLPFPMLMAVLLVSAEIGGGLAMILGFLIRPVAVATAFAMLVATALVHWKAGMFADGGYQWALLLMCISIGLVIDGAGRASVDRLLSTR